MTNKAEKLLKSLEYLYDDTNYTNNGLVVASDGMWINDLWVSGKTVDWNYDVGNNAWAAIAFAVAYGYTNNEHWRVMAQRILDAIVAGASDCNDRFEGYRARPFHVGQMSEQYKRSIEHNIDVFALAKLLDNSTVANRARTFVEAMHGHFRYPNKRGYAAGMPGLSDNCSNSIEGAFWNVALPADGVLWNVLAGADGNQTRLDGGLQWLETELDFTTTEQGFDYTGVKFSTQGDGIQWEAAASTLLAFLVKETADEFSRNISSSLIKLLDRFDVIPAALSQTRSGYDYNYFRVGHLASTVWTGFALLHDIAPLHANPYTVPTPTT